MCPYIKDKQAILFRESHNIYIYIYIYVGYLGSKSLSKHVRLKTTDCFLFKIFKWRGSILLAILLMSRSRWWTERPILAQAISTISLLALRSFVMLFVAMSFIYIHLECLYIYIYIYIYIEWETQKRDLAIHIYLHTLYTYLNICVLIHTWIKHNSSPVHNHKCKYKCQPNSYKTVFILRCMHASGHKKA